MIKHIIISFYILLKKGVNIIILIEEKRFGNELKVIVSSFITFKVVNPYNQNYLFI